MRIRHLAIIPVLAGVLLIIVVFFCGTQSGLIALKHSVNYFGQGIVTIGKVEGRLLDNFSVQNFRLAVPSTKITLAECRIAWRPFALFGGRVSIDSVALEKIDIVLEETGDEVEADEKVLHRSVFPFALHLGKLRARELKLFGNDDLPLLVLDTISASIDGNLRNITIHEVEVDGPEVGLAIQGEIAHKDEWQVELGGEWRLAGYGFFPMKGKYSLEGEIAELNVEVTLTEPGDIKVQGVLRDVVNNPEWNALVTARDFDLSSWIIDCPEIILASVSGDLNGDFGSYRGKVRATGSWDFFDDMQLAAKIDGGELGILFKEIRIDRKNGYVIADGGSISWEEIFSWRAALSVHRFDLSVFSEEIKGLLTGEFISSGDVLEEGLAVTFDVGRIFGTIHDVEIDSKGKLFLDQNGIYTNSLTIKSGKFQGEAIVRNAGFKWDESESWSVDLDLNEFDPAPIHPELWGKVSGSISADGGWSEARYSADIGIQKIRGEFRGQRLEGNGNLQLRKNLIHSDGLFVAVGDSILQLNGGVSDAVNMAFEFQSPALDALLPDVYGAVHVQGHINGTTETPKLKLELLANEIKTAEQSAASINGWISAELSENGAIDISLAADKLSIGGIEAESTELGATGTVRDHEIQFKAADKLFQTSLSAKGGLENYEWQGKLSSLILHSNDFGKYVQEESASVDMNLEKLQLQNFCLRNTIAEGCFNGAVELKDTTNWSANVTLEDVALDKINKLNFMPLEVSGKVSADLTVSGTSDQILYGKGSIKVPQAELAIDSDDNSDEKFLFQDASMIFVLNEESLDIHGSIHEQEGGELLWDIQVDNVGSLQPDFSSMRVKGNVDVVNTHLQLLAGLTHYTIEPRGLLNGNLAIGGWVSDPNISGNIELREGGVELTYQGVTVRDIDFNFEADGTGTNVRGKMASGEGSLRVAGHIDYGPAGTKGKLHLLGTDFQLVNIPEYSVNVNPDVYFTFDDSRGEIEGTVVVPFGLIAPEELTNTVSVSEDVILVGTEENEKKQGWPFYLNIKVILGDDVNIDGYGLTGRLGGDLALRIAPKEFITGRGELDLFDGTFTLYGRSFDIARGRVLFTGGPIDNPGVDVRAQKVVSDEEAAGQGYTVGVDIGGLVQDLDFHLFSDPYMEDTEILSHLILGHSLAGSSEEEGNLLQAAASTLGLAGGSEIIGKLTGFLPIDDFHLEGSAKEENVSLVVGKRITEDLYIGYDMNMFSQLGQFRVRYDLIRGFWVETRSSSESTGADLMYSFER